MDQVPSVGRIVHYVSYGTPGGEFSSENRAAVITAVYPGSHQVALAVLNPTGLFFNESVLYDAGERDLMLKGGGVTYRGGTWHWPERV